MMAPCPTCVPTARPGHRARTRTASPSRSRPSSSPRSTPPRSRTWARSRPTLSSTSSPRSWLPRICRGTTPTFTSTPPVALSWAAPWATRGLTGRKIIVDTYGGYGRHGGGAFSGKDCTRSTAPPHTPRAGSPRTWSPPASADRCEVELAYAIGVSKPLNHGRHLRYRACCRGQDRRSRREDLRPTPGAIIRDWTCAARSTKKTAAYGHFGREDADFTWENTDRVEELKAACGL